MSEETDHARNVRVSGRQAREAADIYFTAYLNAVAQIKDCCQQRRLLGDAFTPPDIQTAGQDIARQVLADYYQEMVSCACDTPCELED